MLSSLVLGPRKSLKHNVALNRKATMWKPEHERKEQEEVWTLNIFVMTEQATTTSAVTKYPIINNLAGEMGARWFWSSLDLAKGWENFRKRKYSNLTTFEPNKLILEINYCRHHWSNRMAGALYTSVWFLKGGTKHILARMFHVHFSTNPKPGSILH